MASISFARAHDYKYDPLFTVSGEKDYYKAGAAAKMKNAKYAIRPIFYSMFSTLPNVPPYRFIMTKTEPIAPYMQPQLGSRAIMNKSSIHDNVHGRNILKYYKSACSIQTLVPEIIIPETPTTYRSQKEVHTTKIKKHRNIKIQTMYRETSAQTSPWEPDYIVKADTDPEILKLDFLKWGSGLPCGAHEITLIQRARMKREWEKNLPPCDTPQNIAKRIALITAMERDEWAFREQEIQDIQDLRLHLLELMLQELHDKSHERSEKKIKFFCEMKEKEKQEKIIKLKKSTEREKRRLQNNFTGAMPKYHKVNVIDEHVTKSSEIYAPLVRHGEHPKRWHQVIDEHLKIYRAKFRDVDSYNTLPKWIDTATKIDPNTLPLKGTRLCIRETKWTVPILKLLHEDLKNLNQRERKKYSLRVKIDKKKRGITTPEVDSISDAEEDMHQAMVLIQSVIRGRASQKIIYDGRERCRELIQELKSTQALLAKEKKKIFAEKLEVQYEQREHQLCLRSALRIKEGLKKIQGSVLGTMLDFLSKELRRLLDERKAHAMCLLYEREREAREAVEAHRRQLELRRRREHDEMFKQVVKVHQDTVDLYLQDIITEGLEFTSDVEAKRYVTSIAKKIDEEPDVPLDMPLDDQEEIIADLVHNYVLPEVQKQYVRETIKKRQRQYLKTVHNAIYKKIEHLPKLPKTPQETNLKMIDDAFITKNEREIHQDLPTIEVVKKVIQNKEVQEAVLEEQLELDEEELSDEPFAFEAISDVDFIKYVDEIDEEETE